jgi:hypothetical protein
LRPISSLTLLTTGWPKRPRPLYTQHSPAPPSLAWPFAAGAASALGRWRLAAVRLGHDVAAGHSWLRRMGRHWGTTWHVGGAQAGPSLSSLERGAQRPHLGRLGVHVRLPRRASAPASACAACVARAQATGPRVLWSCGPGIEASSRATAACPSWLGEWYPAPLSWYPAADQPLYIPFQRELMNLKI